MSPVANKPGHLCRRSPAGREGCRTSARGAGRRGARRPAHPGSRRRPSEAAFVRLEFAIDRSAARHHGGRGFLQPALGSLQRHLTTICPHDLPRDSSIRPDAASARPGCSRDQPALEAVASYDSPHSANAGSCRRARARVPGAGTPLASCRVCARARQRGPLYYRETVLLQNSAA